MNLFKKDNKNNTALKYGGYASVMTAVVIAAVIIINLIASSLNIKADLTKNKLYTLSEDTIEFIKGIDKDVKITTVYAEGEEISVVTELLDKYASYSGHITVANVDPYTNPAFAAQYAKNGESITIGSVVVETGDKYKIISQDELADIYVDSTTGESYMQGIKLESVLTGAIRTLTSGETEKIYALTGHDEVETGEGLKTELGYSGLEVESLDLVTKGNIPEDCEVLIINGAAKDISTNEKDIISEYLNNGGAAFICYGITAEDMTNLNTILENYGIENNNIMVIEGTADSVLENNPFYILPALNSESIITSKMVSGGTSIFMPFSSAVELSQAKRSTVTITALAQTSQYSYGKNLVGMESYEYAQGDPEGPFNVAVLAEDSDGGAKLIVCGAETLMEDDMNSVVNGGNYGFAANCIDYLRGSDFSSRSKSLGAEDYLQLTQSKTLAIMFVCVILIPLIILAAGITVVLKRRNK